MKPILSNFDKANQATTSKKLPIPFLVSKKKGKFSCNDYQTYKFQNNPKDDKSLFYLLTEQYVMDADAAYTLVKSLLQGVIIHAYQNKEKLKTKASKECISYVNAATKHMFPTKVYKM
eukprot:11848225-Ditylum_brightwellii.AAC.1